MHLTRLSLLTLAATTAAAATALADGREPGSLLIYPLQQSALLDPTIFNVVSVTNTNRAGDATTDVHFEYVNVSPSGSPFLFADCTIVDRVETLTPADTLAVLTSCHNGAAAAQGYLVVTALDPDALDTPWSFDHLIGSQQIVTLGGGTYSLNAIPFQSPRPERAKTDISPLDGRRDFDGVEYEPIADELYIDSYIGALAGRIALLSLCGGEYLTNVDFVIYNDDEFQLSGQYAFACWAHVPLADISGYFTAQGLATTNDDPRELDITCDGLQDFDTGWAIVRPKNALSITSPQVTNPAVLGALTLDGGQFNNARLLWESTQKQTNGVFKSSSVPAAPAPVDFAPENPFPAGDGPASVAIGDIDGDGTPDIVTADERAVSLSAMLGALGGNFGPAAPIAVGALPLAVVMGDLDGDLDLDLVTANAFTNNVSVLLGNGDGTFGAPTNFAVGTTPVAVAIGDLDGDGVPDLVTANGGSGNVSVLLGNGNGTFGAAANFAVGTSPVSVAIGDVDGDGDADLVAANFDSNDVSVLLGNGNGTFVAAPNVAVGVQPFSVSLGDLDGDGDLDVVTANLISSNVSVLLGNGDGTYAAASNLAVGSGPRSVAIGDLNGDGAPDLVTANAASNDISVLVGNGDGTFVPAQNFPVGTTPVSVALADLDGDGDLDVVTANLISDDVSVLLGQP
jgi:hypothetical protein